MIFVNIAYYDDPRSDRRLGWDSENGEEILLTEKLRVLVYFDRPFPAAKYGLTLKGKHWIISLLESALT